LLPVTSCGVAGCHPECVCHVAVVVVVLGYRLDVPCDGIPENAGKC